MSKTIEVVKKSEWAYKTKDMPPDGQEPSDFEAALAAHDNLPVDEDALIPDEGIPMSEEDIRREYLPAEEEVAAKPEEAAPEAPKAPEAPVVPVAPVTPALSPEAKNVLDFLQAQEASRTQQAEARRVEAERSAIAAEQARRDQYKALQKDPKWRAERLTEAGLDPNVHANQVLLETHLRQEAQDERLERLEAENRQLRESMQHGRQSIQVQTEVQKFGQELGLPADVLTIVEQQASELVKSGWEPKEALEYAARPLRAFAKARPALPPAPVAPKVETPKPKVLSAEEKKALSMSSLQGRGAGRSGSVNPLQALHNARSNYFGGRRN